MTEIELWKMFASLGLPGVLLGVFYLLFRQFNWKFPRVHQKWVGPLVVLFMVLVAAVTFYGLSLWAPKSSVTILRVSVLGADKMPVQESKVWASIGAETKKVTGGWEMEIVSDKLNENQNVIVFASQEKGKLKGQSEVVVEKGKTTPVLIQLEHKISAKVTGTVTDTEGDPIAGVNVGIIGLAGSTTTDAQGFFMLNAKAIEGEEVRLRAMKSGYETLDQYHPAGATPAYLILRRAP